jgi:hypothetical protein
MTAYTLKEPPPERLLIRRPRWSMSGTRRTSAANLLNVMRISRTEIVQITLRPLRHARDILAAD